MSHLELEIVRCPYIGSIYVAITSFPRQIFSLKLYWCLAWVYDCGHIHGLLGSCLIEILPF